MVVHLFNVFNMLTFHIPYHIVYYDKHCKYSLLEMVMSQFNLFQRILFSLSFACELIPRINMKNQLCLKERNIPCDES